MSHCFLLFNTWNCLHNSGSLQLSNTHRGRYLQVWLRHDASLAKQNQRHEAVGAALDQELLVWRPVEEDPCYSALNAAHTPGFNINQNASPTQIHSQSVMFAAVNKVFVFVFFSIKHS